MPLYGLSISNISGQQLVTKSGSYTILGGSQSTGVPVAGTLIGAPIYVPKMATLDRIGAEITATTDATAVYRLGIYGVSIGRGPYPDALILDAGTILATAGAGAAIREITISQVLIPGVYWLAGVTQTVTTTVPTLRTALEYPYSAISASATNLNADLIGLTVTGVTGALPASWGISTTPTNTVPRLFVRVV